MRDSRKMWQMPWGYPESVAIVCGLIVIGLLLQITIGYFDFYLLLAPVNLILGGGVVILSIASLLVHKGNFIRWFTGVSFSVSLIAALLVLSLIMGVTLQVPDPANVESKDIFSRLGFIGMTSSWAFILIYLIMLLSLGSLIACKLYHFRRAYWRFYISHIGVWLVLFAAGLGYADMERYIMHVYEGEVEWRVYDDKGNIKELPIAIELNDFDTELYPPQLTIIDRLSGTPQPEAKPDFYQIDVKSPKGYLNGWDVELVEYIHKAVRNSDSTYREAHMPGATPAAWIKITDRLTKNEVLGWVCGGNQAQLHMTLPLSDRECVVMTVAEPKRFTSDIEIYTSDGVHKSGVLEVNKPMRVDGWTIYQYGYDNQAGALSPYSSMELVYDPWLIIVYIGFLSIAIGSISMVWSGNKREYGSNVTKS